MSDCTRSCMQQSAIKSYDVRGIVGKDFIEQDTYFFVRALLDFLQKNNHDPIQKIIIGYDHRATSKTIEQFVVQACVDFGVHNLFVLCVPTPVLQFAMHQGFADVGIMITASHNPLHYNGLKLWYKTQSLQGSVLQSIWQSMQSQQYKLPVLQRVACLQSTDFIMQAYYNFLDKQFSMLHSMQYSVLCMVSGGPVQSLLEWCIQYFGWQHVDIVGCKNNRECIVFNPDPTSLETQTFIKDVLSNKTYDCVLAFDGDADRFVLYTSQGKILSGDEVGFLFVQYMGGVSAVMDIKTSGGLVHVLQENGVQVILAPTGCADIKKAIHEHNAQFGCEVSGHYFFKEHHFIDDGLYAALSFLQCAVQAGCLQDVCAALPPLHDSVEMRLPLGTAFDRDFVINYLHDTVCKQYGEDINLIDGIRYHTEIGWLMMRASKTEPVLSLRYGVFDVHYKAEWVKIVKECIQPFIVQAVIEKYEW